MFSPSKALDVVVSTSYSHVILEAELVPDSLREHKMQYSSFASGSLSNDFASLDSSAIPVFDPLGHGSSLPINSPSFRSNSSLPGAFSVGPSGETDRRYMKAPASIGNSSNSPPGAYLTYVVSEDDDSCRIQIPSSANDTSNETGVSVGTHSAVHSGNEAVPASDPFAGVDVMQDAIIRKTILNDSLQKHRDNTNHPPKPHATDFVSKDDDSHHIQVPSSENDTAMLAETYS
eukprot:CAMPEP_0171293432 /NCGR_PEP_ID=MMETSP0816-20121228/1668_1 /TAXON_ID=420281 /ORGANISM="Proboscia inermis, Strain CCAP1064/1" /LENGTH=231 /DNA_ID=CAMNT_0011764271 /DNA_START=307 /DNA_END=1002 /DNA_ORIENTATION=-